MSNAERRKQIFRDIEKAREILTAMAERRPTREMAERAAVCLEHAHHQAKRMAMMLSPEDDDNTAGG